MSLVEAAPAETTGEAIPHLTSEGDARPAVLHVIEATLGGTLVYLDTIIRATEGLPFRFGLAYASERATPALAIALAQARDRGWQTFPLEMTRNVRLGRDLRSAWQIIQLYKKFKPDVVHSHSSKAGALTRLARLGFPRRSPRVVYTPNAVAAPLGKHYWLIERLLRPLTTRMIPVSESEAKELTALQLTYPGHFKIVDPVVDTASFVPGDQHSARAALGLPLEGALIVAVGRLTAQKAPHTFLHILKAVREKAPDVRGVWVGDGEMRESFLQAATDLGLAENLVLAGWKDDVRPWLAASDLLLSTSVYESFGYMVAESFAMERPVVATRITGTCDILQNDFSHWLYEEGDVPQAVELILELLNHPRQAAAVAVAGREMIAQRFSPQVMRQRLLELYSELS